MKGSDWMNGTQGTILSMTMPSPALKRHFFYHQSLAIYRSHNTVTDRGNAILTSEETSAHTFLSECDFGILVRF